MQTTNVDLHARTTLTQCEQGANKLILDIENMDSITTAIELAKQVLMIEAKQGDIVIDVDVETEEDDDDFYTFNIKVMHDDKRIAYAYVAGTLSDEDVQLYKAV